MRIDLVTLSETVVRNFLVPFVRLGPHKMGEEVTKTFGPSVASHLTKTSKKIWDRVNAAFSSDPEARALTQLRVPDEDGIEFVQKILLRKLKEHPQLALDLRQLVEATIPDGGATSGAEAMQSSGILDLFDSRGADSSHSQHASEATNHRWRAQFGGMKADDVKRLNASATQSEGGTAMNEPTDRKGPVRGFPGLTVAASSPQTTAGSDFSIFVIVQNPFDVPITIHQVQTHIPIELIDINAARLELVQEVAEQSSDKLGARLAKWLVRPFAARARLKQQYSGVAIALGTEVTTEEIAALRAQVDMREARVEGGTVAGILMHLHFPENPSAEELDRLFFRMHDYQRGLIPTTLQPGDSVVKQFVLKTRSWLFFTPLNHTFQIQVSYSVDGVDHTGTIAYELNIASTLGAIAWGAVAGAVLGTLLKGLSQPALPGGVSEMLQALAVSIMAGLAVVVAFARKSNAQSLVSVEDFWGGIVIGFTVGFFGFEQFFNLFSRGSSE
jgi:hypothetical protein